MEKSKAQDFQSRNTFTLKKKTADSFGFEWTWFHQLKSENGFLEFVSLLDKIFLKDTYALDAGCGNGSDAYYSASYGTEVVAIDFSDSVSVARENTRNMDVQEVRADITQSPFKERTFDHTFSIGVLPHHPEPETGFHYLVPLLKSGALISMLVYGRAKQWAVVYFYEPPIKILHHLPHRLLYDLSYFQATIMKVTNYFFLLLKRIHLTKLVCILPFKFYADYPFSVKLNDAFETLATPSAQCYTEKEISAWFTRSNLTDINVTTADVSKGIKGFGVNKRNGE